MSLVKIIGESPHSWPQTSLLTAAHILFYMPNMIATIRVIELVTPISMSTDHRHYSQHSPWAQIISTAHSNQHEHRSSTQLTAITMTTQIISTSLRNHWVHWSLAQPSEITMSIQIISNHCDHTDHQCGKHFEHTDHQHSSQVIEHTDHQHRSQSLHTDHQHSSQQSLSTQIIRTAHNNHWAHRSSEQLTTIIEQTDHQNSSLQWAHKSSQLATISEHTHQHSSQQSLSTQIINTVHSNHCEHTGHQHS